MDYFNGMLKELGIKKVSDTGLYMEALKYVLDNNLCSEAYIFANMAGLSLGKDTTINYSTDYISVRVLSKTMSNAMSRIADFVEGRDFFIGQTTEREAVLNYMREKRVTDPRAN